MRHTILSLALILIHLHGPGLAQEIQPLAAPLRLPPRQPVDLAQGSAGVVASASPLASAIGCDCLADGGNAVDAAIAVGFALAVTWPEAGNLGGGGFMLVAPAGSEEPSADRIVRCIDYRETAPSAATEDSFVNWTDRRHPRMAGTPGTVRGFESAHRRYGSMPWKRLIEPSIRLAREGFLVDRYLAYSLNSVLSDPLIRDHDRYAEFRRVYQHPSHSLWRPGDRLLQPDLAKTLETIAENGADGFYTGRVADAIDRQMRSDDGLISRQDLHDYQPVVRTAIERSVLGYQVFGAPPPSSGGLTVGLQLKMIESLGLQPQADVPWTVDHLHLMSEVMRRAFRQRAAFLGDPDFSTLQLDGFSDQAAARLAAEIDHRHATPSGELAGDIALTDGPYESEQTTHYSVIDATGMAVSNTTTLEQSFGSLSVVAGCGFLLNNEMGDFNWRPGYTNTEGAIGTSANLVAPGKRMLSSMSPTIVKQDGKVRLIVGSPGGRTIINSVCETIVQTLLFDRSLADAVDAPRFHHQWFPDAIYLEGFDPQAYSGMIGPLQSRGHVVIQTPGRRQGAVNAIEVDLDSGIATAVADWRRGGAARAVRSKPVANPTASRAR
ncbi:gamma-glutamyltransferase [Stieleria sp. TO1_6]|uniref:gamma-glutamyltransferase n=1 Tax=Stieleria tagensis TaxID=2956795 RepID=UPI00209AC06F|nr:gamma-glutamyltransferase [Stieleria tagensis]MCO8122288.1 gamma-glutamyltransferase [Stieleria tagensis]